MTSNTRKIRMYHDKFKDYVQHQFTPQKSDKIDGLVQERNSSALAL